VELRIRCEYEKKTVIEDSTAFIKLFKIANISNRGQVEDVVDILVSCKKVKEIE
jgi:hypothetical protein